ncbi:MAG TPA: SLBB domain-containing protein [Candidatus Marinimicrobia bacterium]|nr:SLBB domain-containing protein [Candidatus Neomarinimicrobiota bacterium]HQC61558.1 SLBB domain-containing protein [Candidatus Neomarinimicrobiota bacterium]
MKRVSLFMILTLLSVQLYSQESQTITTRSGRTADRLSASKYILSTGSDAMLMTVKIWGEVTRPGLYDVPIGTDLIDLISAAGGPTTRANLSKVKLIHGSPDEEENYVTIVNIKKFLETGDLDMIPEIKPSDTIVVPVKITQHFLTSLSWTQQLLSLFSIYSMILYYTSVANR